MKVRKVILSILTVVPLAALIYFYPYFKAWFHFKPPPCEIDANFKYDYVGNAGCFVVNDGRMLTVTQAMTGKLNTPGGMSDNGEPAQCTAHRETFEEAGIHVRVGEVFKVYPKFYLFHCEIVDDNYKLGPIDEFRHEVSSAQWTDVFQTKDDDWRYAKEPDAFRSYFLKHKQ